MQKTITSFLKFIVLLAIAIGLLLLAFRGIDIRKTLHEISQANLFWLFASVTASIVAFVSRAYRWNLLIEPLDYSPKLKNTAYALMVGYLANLAFPRLGEVTRCGSLSKAEKIPFNSLLGTVIVERVIDVICLLICMLLAAVVEYDRLKNFLTENVLNPMADKLIQTIQSPTTIFILIAVVAAIAVIAIVYVKKRKQSGDQSGFVHLVKGLIDGLRSIGRLKRPGAFLFHSVLIWVMYFYMSYLCLFSLSFTSNLYWTAGLLVLVVGGIGMSAPVQGGIGIYHILVSKGLMLYGLSREEGLVYATLIHTSQLLVVIFLGSISLLLLFLGNKENAHAGAGKDPVQNPQ